MGVARGMIGSERLCLEPGSYRIRVRSPTQTYTFTNVAIASGQQTQLTLIPKETVFSKAASQSEALIQPCPVPGNLAQDARTR
jgi:hypothetical protein